MSVLVLHWGRTGAGPRLARDLTSTFSATSTVTPFLSFASGGELETSLNGLLPEERTFPVRTYRNAAGMILGVPRAFTQAIRLRKLIQKHRIQAVISPMMSLWHSLLARVIVPSDVAYVATVHDATQHPGDENLLARFCSRIDVKRADILVTMSSSVSAKLDILLRNGKPILTTVHPAFIDNTVVKPRSLDRSKEIRIGIFGRLKTYKGTLVFADALELLVERGFLVTGLAAGQGLSMEEEEYLRQRGIQVKNQWIPEAEVNGFVRSLDILALPYREASQSGAVAIGMAEGVPCVVSPVGGLVEQVSEGKCGVVAEDMSAGSFADAVQKLIETPGLYSRISREAIEEAGTSFSWNRVADDYVTAANQAILRQNND